MRSSADVLPTEGHDTSSRRQAVVPCWPAGHDTSPAVAEPSGKDVTDPPGNGADGGDTVDGDVGLPPHAAPSVATSEITSRE